MIWAGVDLPAGDFLAALDAYRDGLAARVPIVGSVGFQKGAA